MFEQQQILDYLRLFVQPGQVTELRSFGGGAALAGWFDYDHLATAAQAAAEMQRAASGVYFLPNPVNPALLSRRRNAVGPARECTTDADILRRRWLLIDVDPVRPTGTNATDAERAAAWGVLCSVQHALPGLSGEIVGSSGNGWHLCYPIDAPNDDETRDKIRAALIGLQDRCGAPGAAVDAKTFNAARIWKLYGTAARKGVASVDRPHRIAFLAGSPTAPTEAVRQANTAALWALLETWKRQADAYQTLTAPTTTSDAAKRARSYLGRIPPAKKLVNSHQILADALVDAECDARLILGEARDSLDGTKVRGNWTPGIADEVDEKISIVIGKLIAAKSAIGVYRQISNAIRYQRS